MLIENQIYPDPYVGVNSKAIPDIGEVGANFYSWWFRKTFELGILSPKQNQRLWLQMRGINYRASIYFNGRFVGATEGMFLRTHWDVTNFLEQASNSSEIHSDALQCVAILVEPPPNHGKVPASGGQGGDHDIGKDVTAQYTAGWDWIIPIADRNTGIWDKIDIRLTGPVQLRNPWADVIFPSECWNAGNIGVDQADFDIVLSAGVEIFNCSDCAVSGTLTIEISDPEEDDFQEESEFVCIAAYKSADVIVPSNSCTTFFFGDIKLERPWLWWPNGVGKNQPLYKCKLTLLIKSSDVQDNPREEELSDEIFFSFGVRDLQSLIDPKTNGRIFTINGHNMFVRGGNWIVSDAMLRFTDERYCNELGLWQQMGMNMIRVWGGGITERPEFYSWCDVYGLLVWQEFWITGDNFGRGGGDSQYPLDHALFLRCAEDAVKMLRWHTSLAMWCGGNEQRPCRELEDSLRAIISSLDCGRLFVCGSLWEGFGDGEGGHGFSALHDGPYTIQNPNTFFRDDFYAYAFNPEIGSVGFPVKESLNRFLRLGEASLPQFWRSPLSENIEEKVSPFFDHHKYLPYTNPSLGVYNQICLYGVPETLEEFCDQAQLANYEQYRALTEAWGSRMWTKYTGMLIWKVQNPWPGLRGQLYDWYLEKTGGFYGCAKGLEPIHIQLNLCSFCLEVINTTPYNLQGLTVKARAMDPNGVFIVFFFQDNIKVDALGKWQSNKVVIPNESLFVFLDLYEQHPTHKYWLHSFSKWKAPVKAGLKKLRTFKSTMLFAEQQGVNDDLEELSSTSFHTSSSLHMLSRNTYWRPQDWEGSRPGKKAPSYHHLKLWAKTHRVILQQKMEPFLTSCNQQVLKTLLVRNTSNTPAILVKLTAAPNTDISKSKICILPKETVCFNFFCRCVSSAQTATAHLHARVKNDLCCNTGCFKIEIEGLNV